MYATTSGLFALTLIASQWISTAGVDKFGGGFKDASSGILDLHEIQRQNRITTQILQNYIEKKLYGQNRSSRPPSIWDILPMRTRRKPPKANNIQEAINSPNENETLVSGESETVSAYQDYQDNDEQGKFRLSLISSNTESLEITPHETEEEDFAICASSTQ